MKEIVSKYLGKIISEDMDDPAFIETFDSVFGSWIEDYNRNAVILHPYKQIIINERVMCYTDTFKVIENCNNGIFKLNLIVDEKVSVIIKYVNGKLNVNSEKLNVVDNLGNSNLYYKDVVGILSDMSILYRCFCTFVRDINIFY